MVSASVLENFHWCQRMILRVPLMSACVCTHFGVLEILNSVRFGPHCGCFSRSTLCTLVHLRLVAECFVSFNSTLFFFNSALRIFELITIPLSYDFSFLRFHSFGISLSSPSLEVRNLFWHGSQCSFYLRSRLPQ